MDNQTVKFKYIFNDDYDPEYINGAFGGLNTTGELVVNFYMDRIPIPYEVKQMINDDGTLNEEVEVTKPDEMKIRRVVKNGVVMNKDTAVSVYLWLKNQLKEMGVDDDEL